MDNPEQLSLGIVVPIAASAMGELNSQRQVEGNVVHKKRPQKPLSAWPPIGTRVTLPWTVFSPLEASQARFEATFSGTEFTVDPKYPEEPPQVMGRCTWAISDLEEAGLSGSLIALLPRRLLVRVSEMQKVEEGG